jgi:hypothetical protein
MALQPDEELEFDEDGLEPIAALFDELAAAGRGWVNLLPEVEPGRELPPRSLFSTVFSARGEAVPFATWTAPDQPGGRPTIGLTHGSGPKALPRLADAGLPLAPGWLRAADHPRRGVVVTVPADAPADEVLWWLLAAAHALCPVPLTGSWLARVYRR